MAIDPPAAPKRPLLPDELEETALGDAALTGLRLERVSLRGLELVERAAADLRIDESLLHDVALDGSEAAGLTLTDVRVENGSWANLRAVRGSLTRIEARELRATGADFAESELRDCELTGLTGAGSLRGIRMPWNDVLQLAGLLAAATGIEVVD